MKGEGKVGLDSLALFGGAPAFSQAMHVGRPNIGDRDRLLSRIESILDRRWLTNNGPVVQEFEREIARITGAKHAIAVCNATIGLEIAIRATGMTGEVIVPSFTFIATAHALQWQGITPVFCDVDKAHQIDPAYIEALITPRTTGIIGVHLWGVPCAVDILADIAQRHGLRLLFDAAHAFGASWGGRMVGTFGDAEVFSFHATKVINAFEGGAVTTNDDALADRLRSMRNFGFAGVDCIEGVGTNGKMCEVSAAMGLTSLESTNAIIAANQHNYQVYALGLAGIPGVRLYRYDKTERRNYQYIVVEVDPDEAGISRDALVDVLTAENVPARRYFYPGCHQAEPYRTLYPNAWERLPETERLTARVMTLPTGTSVEAAGVLSICDLIRYAVRNGAGITARIESVKTESSAA